MLQFISNYTDLFKAKNKYPKMDVDNAFKTLEKYRCYMFEVESGDIIMAIEKATGKLIKTLDADYFIRRNKLTSIS